MGIIKKISYTLLALTVSAQIGNFAISQVQVREGSMFQKLQKTALFTPLAEAAGSYTGTFDTYNGQGGAIVTYIKDGNVTQQRINGATGTTVRFDDGSVFITTYNGKNTKYDAPTRNTNYRIERDGSLSDEN